MGRPIGPTFATATNHDLDMALRDGADPNNSHGSCRTTWGWRCAGPFFVKAVLIQTAPGAKAMTRLERPDLLGVTGNVIS
jgi:hypothetical protein